MTEVVKADTGLLRQYAARLNNVNNCLAALDVQLDGLYAKVNLSQLNALGVADWHIRYSSTIKYCADTLSKCADDLEQCERKIVNYEYRHSEWETGNWWSLIKNAGTAGAVISLAGYVSTERINGGKVVKDITSLAEKYYSSVAEGKLDVEKILGLNLKTLDDCKKSASESIFKKINDLPDGIDEKNLSAVSAAKKANVLKNIGNIVELGQEAVENWQENDNKVRAVGETVVEYGVKICEKAVLDGLATVALGAVFGTVGAPAVAVGVTTTVAMWGIDAICKTVTEKLTGEAKPFDEVVSDFVIDGVKKQAKKLGNAVRVGKKLLNDIGVGWKKICPIF